MEKPNKNIRVLHVPTSVGGSPQGLAIRERQHGIDSQAITLSASKFEYGSDETLWRPNDNVLKREFKRIKLIWRAARDFDIVHYNFGTTIADPPWPYDPLRDNAYPRLLHQTYYRYANWLQSYELQLMKRRAKKIFVTYQGNDARQGDYLRQNYEISPLEAGGRHFYSPVWDADKRRRISQLTSHASKVYAFNPDIMNVLPKRTEFLPYAHLDLQEWRPTTNQKNDTPLVIHAPSNRNMKGTQFILNAVERLQAERVPFRFQLIENLPNKQAREIYQQADVLIDQLLIGWYGGLALECMALGKPVICYIRKGDLRHIPGEMAQQLPIINASPASIYEVLKETVTNEATRLKEIGMQSRKFVERWHNPETLTARVIADYRIALAEQDLQAAQRSGDQ